MDPQAPLRDFKPSMPFFVGIDSDGCVFDTMELKHKECFLPNTIRVWGLQSIAKYVREVGEFVNLYSCHRGINRWPGLVKVIEMAAARPEVQERNPRLPDLTPLKEFIASGLTLTDASVRRKWEETGDPIFQRALEWSAAVNRSVDEMVEGVPPFPGARESLAKLAAHADVVVVSATPAHTIRKEWAEHDIAQYARLIASQEMGLKHEHLALAAAGKYERERILMIGDALGDLKAARHVGALFYPIVPGKEAQSWWRFHEEACERFFDGTYAGEYEAEMIEDFKKVLPDNPPWERNGLSG